MNWQNIREQFHRGNFNIALEHIETNISSLSSIEDERKESYLQELLWLKTKLRQVDIQEGEGQVFSIQAGGILAFLRELERQYMDYESESDFGFSAPRQKEKPQKSFISISLDQDFDNFNDEHELSFKNQVLAFLDVSPIDLNLSQRRRGSVLMELELPLIKEKEFFFGILRGGLKEYKIKAARILTERYLDNEEEDEKREENQGKLLIKESPELIRELYINMYPWMLTTAFKYFNDWDQSHDVAHEVLLRLLEKDKLREIKSSTRGFILIALHNECKNIVKRIKNRSRLLKENESKLVEILFQDGEQHSINKLDLEKIKTRTHEILNEEQNLVLVLQSQGYNYREIGKRLNKTENNARQIRHKAVSILRNDPVFNEIMKR